MNPEALDWPVLDRLRRLFLDGTAGQADYWTSDRDLWCYDETHGRRIGWKWDWVLEELKRRGWSPPQDSVLDWGCGTGVAARALARAFGTGACGPWSFVDRSPRATAMAARLATEEHPGITVQRPAATAPGTLLISHVVSELNSEAEQRLLDIVRRATVVLWVEPGTGEASRRLLRLREQLRADFHLVAPCTHACACGLLAPGNELHWCHHFAPSPPEVHTDGHWVRFGQLAGIDLRSLPLSYLVLDRRPPPPLPPGTFRIVGRPRVYKAHALLFGCDATGVRDYRLTRRGHPDAFREVRKHRTPSLQCWALEGLGIRELSVPFRP